MSTAVQGHSGSEAAGAERLRDAQEAMRSLLEGAGLGEARASDVGKALGLDKSLAWKVARFIRDDDPSLAARHMPGTGGVDIVLRAAAARGVGDERVAAVRAADRALREFVEQHAGDRRSFEAMFAGDGTPGRLESDVRRELFRAGSAAWGVRARTQFLTLALRPSAEVPGMLDFVQVGGLVDLERLRTDVPWIFRRFYVHNDSGSEAYRVRREPLDPEGAGAMPLLSRFCSHPMPAVHRFEGPDGCVYDELVPGRVGRRGAVTVVTGERYLAAASHVRSAENAWAVYPLIVRTPVEGVQFDVLVHPDLGHLGPARTHLRGLLEDRPRGGGGTMEPAAVAASAVSPMGGGGSSRVPRYAELLREAFERAGWGEPDGYRAYRADVEYPLAPSEVTMLCEIGEAKD